MPGKMEQVPIDLTVASKQHAENEG